MVPALPSLVVRLASDAATVQLTLSSICQASPPRSFSSGPCRTASPAAGDAGRGWR